MFSSHYVCQCHGADCGISIMQCGGEAGVRGNVGDCLRVIGHCHSRILNPQAIISLSLIWATYMIYFCYQILLLPCDEETKATLPNTDPIMCHTKQKPNDPYTLNNTNHPTADSRSATHERLLYSSGVMYNSIPQSELVIPCAKVGRPH